MAAPVDTVSALHSVLSANFPQLDLLPDQPQLHAVAPHCRVRCLTGGATLFAQGSAGALYGVLSGEMAMRFCSVDGEVSVIEIAPRPRLFGLAALAGGQPSSYEAVAHKPASVLVIGEPAFVQLMDGLPGFGRALMREFALRHDGALKLLQASRLQGAGERLSLALHHLIRAGRVSVPDSEGQVLLRTTQAELATLAGLSRQTVNEWLQRMARRGHLQPVYGGVRLQAASAASMSAASFSGASWGA
jgi:CRP-like cAMP-binding protein